MRRRLVAALVAIVIVVIAVLAFARGRGLTAARESWPGEAWVARAAWRWLVPRDARGALNPVPGDAETLRAAREHWADHCATCHGNDGSGDTALGRRTFPPAPDMRLRRTQDLTDGELFYAIERGVPWTAMPAWGTGTPEGVRDSWALVRFVRRLPAMTPEEIRDMERFNPRSPAAEQRDKEIEDFLNGGTLPQQPVKEPGQ